MLTSYFTFTRFNCVLLPPLNTHYVIYCGTRDLIFVWVYLYCTSILYVNKCQNAMCCSHYYNLISMILKTKPLHLLTCILTNRAKTRMKILKLDMSAFSMFRVDSKIVWCIWPCWDKWHFYGPLYILRGSGCWFIYVHHGSCTLRLVDDKRSCTHKVLAIYSLC